MTSLAASLLEKLVQNNCRGAIVPIRRLKSLQQDMTALYRERLVSHDMINRYLTRFRFDYLSELPDARSIIVVAIPQPITVLRFEWREQEHAVVVPPIYIYTEAEKAVFTLVTNELKREKFLLVPAQLPLKLLAVRSGLSEYGRNNISYIGGMGSFYRLFAMISDVPSHADIWQDVRRMSQCDACRLCCESCPCGCIEADRDLIRATKCLTYFNESSPPFPAWVDTGWHNALVGCMRCQLACPQNRRNGRQQDERHFLASGEIELLLAANHWAELPDSVHGVLEKLDLTAYELPAIKRNLRVLLKA